MEFKYRWYLEVFLVLTYCGVFFNYNFGVGIHNSLQQHFKNNEHVYKNYEFYFNLLYSAFALPNIIFPFITGRLSDIFGNRGLLFSLCICGVVGQGIIYIGSLVVNIWLMIVGRAIAGLAIGSLMPLCSKMVSHYFQGALMAMVLSMNFGLGTLCDSFNIYISSKIAQKYSVNFCIFLCFMTTIISFIASIIVIYIDKKGSEVTEESKLTLNPDFSLKNSEILGEPDKHSEASKRNPLQNTLLSKQKLLATSHQSYALDTIKQQKKNKSQFSHTLTLLKLSNQFIDTEKNKEDEKEQQDSLCTIIKSLKKEYWLTALSISVILWATASFAGNIMPILQDIHYKNLPPLEIEKKISDASLYLLILQTPLYPIMGLIVDKLNLWWRMVVGITGSFLLGFLFFFAYYLEVMVIIVLFASGISFFISAMWSFIPLIVHGKLLGIAYGLIVCLKFGGIFLNSMLVGYLGVKNEGHEKKYLTSLSIMGAYTGIAIVCQIIIILLEEKHNIQVTKKQGKSIQYSEKFTMSVREDEEINIFQKTQSSDKLQSSQKFKSQQNNQYPNFADMGKGQSVNYEDEEQNKAQPQRQVVYSHQNINIK